jgi:hypothetical protein
MLTSLDAIRPGAPFPPSDATRLQTCEHVDNLLEGEHGTVFMESFMRLMRDDGTIVEIDLPWVRKTRLIFADLLCGEPGRIRCEDTEQQPYLDDLIRRLDLWRNLHEACGDTVSYGDGVLKLRKRNGKVTLSPQPPKFWFPVVEEDDIRSVIGHVLTWKINRGDESNPKWVGKAEVHRPGNIDTYTFTLNYDGTKIGEITDQTSVKSGVKDMLLFHAPNWRTSSELCGHSIFDDADSILSEMEVRYAQMSKVLDKHSDPGMYGPENALEQDPKTGEWKVKGGRFYPLVAGDEKPGYVTWDGMLFPNIEMVKLLREELYAATDTCPALFGKLEQGMAESGSALKRLLISPLAAVNRLRLTYDPIVAAILRTAAELEGETLSLVTTEWRDGLPEDGMEAAQIEQTRASAGNTSTEASVVRLDGLEGKQLTEELARIEKDNRPAPTAPPAITLPPRAGVQALPNTPAELQPTR